MLVAQTQLQISNRWESVARILCRDPSSANPSGSVVELPFAHNRSIQSSASPCPRHVIDNTYWCDLAIDFVKVGAWRQRSTPVEVTSTEYGVHQPRFPPEGRPLRLSSLSVRSSLPKDFPHRFQNYSGSAWQKSSLYPL